MATMNSWIEHPGFYIREEMEARGWSQRDVAFILGIPEPSLNTILSGKRGISPDMAKALGKAFDVPPEFFANLQQSYDLARAKEPSPEVEILGKMHASYPVREMINRGWLEKADVVILEEQLVRFFQVKSTAEIPYMPHAAKKSRYEELDVPPAQLAWLFRVKQIAKSISVAKYSESSLRRALTEMEQLLLEPEGAREVPRLLANAGVRFIVVEKLTNAKIDGVCFWLDASSPVIGMSMQRDTIDNFWFVLRHEIEHVLEKHGRDTEIIDTDVQGDQGTSLQQEEVIANAAALEFTVTPKFDSFMVRKHPYYYERDVVGFARVVSRHPGIIVGQMQRRLNNYKYLTRYLAKVRQFVLPVANVDGWNHVMAISL